jgi:hypothetical protein
MRGCRTAGDSVGPVSKRTDVAFLPRLKEPTMMRCRRPSILVSAVAVAAVSLVQAGCGGGSPRVASVTSSTTVRTTSQYGAVAFSRCMRSQGELNFPDPDSSGVFDGTKLKQLGASGQLRSVAQLRAAQSQCNHLLPNGVPLARQTITLADEADYLRAAECMRSHGFPGFPDPAFHNSAVSVNLPASVNPSSAQFERAARNCAKLIPRGLPNVRPDGS